MTTAEQVDSLIIQLANLPKDVQAELVQSLIEMRAVDLGIYNLDDDA
jgi:hypothetical protein